MSETFTLYWRNLYTGKVRSIEYPVSVGWTKEEYRDRIVKDVENDGIFKCVGGVNVNDG